MAFDVRAQPGRRRRVAWLAAWLTAVFGLLWLLVALRVVAADRPRPATSPAPPTTLCTDTRRLVDALMWISRVGHPAVVRVLLLLVAGYALARRRVVIAEWLALVDRAGARCSLRWPQAAAAATAPRVVRPARGLRRLLVPVRARRRCGTAGRDGRAADPRRGVAALGPTRRSMRCGC